MASTLYLVGASLIALATAQTTIPGTLCKWQEARGAVVRDSLYIEGGLYATIKDGKCSMNPSKYGQLFTLNFSVPFDTTSNLTQLFRPLNETIDPSAVTYVNGFMVADNDEWYTFGGQAYPEANQYTINSGITRNALYQPNPAASGAALGITPNYQPTRGNLTNKYISNGAGVNVPSESLGFYFSGMRSPNSTNISFIPATSGYDAPATLVSNMIKVDTSVFGESSWNSIPLPDNVVPRAEAAMAWIPTGPKGMLVVLGGVPYPADLPQLGCFLNNSVVNSNNNVAPSFMTNVTIYDVASGRWYVQPTAGTAPPQLAQACAVVATGPNNATHNIYLYGGYNGVDGTGANDDVWVLSLPSFTWVKAAAGTTNHARYAHVCAKPYPDQMMVVGGTTQCGNELKTAAIVDVFNLNTLQWTGSYDPTKWSEYAIPSVISDAIKSTPTANMDGGLLALFQSPYPSALPHWYPYTRAFDGNVTPSTGSKPGWVVPVAASVASVGAIAIGVLLWFLYRKHKKSKKGSGSTQGLTSNWVQDQSQLNHSSNMSEAETAQNISGSHGIYEAYGDHYHKDGVQTNVAELQSSTDGNSTRMGSPYGGSSPTRGPHSRSPSDSAELPNTVTRFELAAEPIGFVAIPNIRNHPMYPASVDGHLSSAQSAGISSPTTSAISSATQSPSYTGISNAGGLSPPPNDMLLGASRTSRGYWDPKSPDSKLSPLDEDDLPPSPSDISPALSPNSEEPPTPPEAPRTPPTQPSNNHKRNVSSLDSGLTTLPSPGPNEELRRSAALAALPPSPERQNGNSSSAHDQVTVTDQSPSHRDLQNRPRQQLSAYEENDDMYSGSNKNTQAK